MKINLVPLLMLLGISYGGYAQVGINTNTPKATLDVSANVLPTNTTANGVLIPRVTVAELDAKSAYYTTLQNGALVYVTGGSSSNAKTANITGAGFYYYDAPNSVWKTSTMDLAGNGSFTPKLAKIYIPISEDHDPKWGQYIDCNFMEIYQDQNNVPMPPAIGTGPRSILFPPASLFKDKTIYIKNNSNVSQLNYISLPTELKNTTYISQSGTQQYYSDGTRWYAMGGAL